MKKVFSLLTCVLMALLLIGCGQANNRLEDQLVKKAGIHEREDYQSYEGFVHAGELDDNGYYIEIVERTPEEHAPIHVTFADNKNLVVRYYSDKAHQKSIDQSECYLNPGDLVYAHVEISDDVVSNLYEFAGFRFFDITDQGSRKETNLINCSGTDTEYIISIPVDYTGMELAVEPIGAYENRVIHFSDYLVGENGKKSDLNGLWFVNDKACETKSAEISPVSSYIISYQYDSNEYFYVSSEPESFYKDNAEGIVIFKQRDPLDSTPNYSVELHEYLTVSVVSDMDRYVRIGNNDMLFVAANTELIIPNLRYGQKVVLTTNKEWGDLEKCSELILMSSGKRELNYEYTLLVPEKDGEFLFDPAEYKYDHGTVSFFCFGNEVKSPQVLAKGSKIYFEQNTAEDGFWLPPGDNNFVIVEEEASTKQQLRDIHFTPKVQVTVALERPEYGGTVTYSVDGNTIHTDTYSTYSGTVIEINFDPWEGWILNKKAHDKDTYVVNDSKSQSVKGEEYSISSVFEEDKNHKPALTVTLEKSVGEDMEFSISASGFKTEVSSYGGGWKIRDLFDPTAGKYNLISNNQDIISQQKIGTEKPITLSMGNRALQYGQAVRLIISKVDSTGNETSETRYITDFTSVPEPIYIYRPEEQARSKVWYKSVHITIGVVDIERFARLTPSAHTTITVRNLLTNEMMSGDELIEGTQKVVVSIRPDKGYYITGKKVTNDTYQKTMKYSEYVKNMADIIDKHPAAPFYTIVLDDSDAFATYQYKLDGKEVSGTIAAKEGQKLTLLYEITDSSFRLRDASGGIPLVGWGKSYTKVEKELIVTSVLDGKTVTKNDFEIVVVKGE